MIYTLHWRHNGRDGVSNDQPHDCLLKRLFRRRSKETSKLRVTAARTGEFPAQMASNAENAVTGYLCLLSGEPDYFGRNKISSGGDLSHYSSASLY